jgi:hypothetical protein
MIGQIIWRVGTRLIKSNMADAKSEIHNTWGERKFCDIPDTYISSAIKSKESNEDCGKLCEYIERHCLGRDFEFTGPFGKRKGLFFIIYTYQCLISPQGRGRRYRWGLDILKKTLS